MLILDELITQTLLTFEIFELTRNLLNLNSSKSLLSGNKTRHQPEKRILNFWPKIVCNDQIEVVGHKFLNALCLKLEKDPKTVQSVNTGAQTFENMVISRVENGALNVSKLIPFD
jgi:hypothetical protein